MLVDISGKILNLKIGNILQVDVPEYEIYMCSINIRFNGYYCIKEKLIRSMLHLAKCTHVRTISE